jgi:murein DD-endopeptidase MepM/ murein hydrolase activator NlpD
MSVHDRGEYGLHLCHSFTHRGHTLYAFYAHLQSVSVAVGDVVTLDQEIARTGASGNARGLSNVENHLHFEIREKAECGTGLLDRLSPIRIFGICPLSGAADGYQIFE